MRIEDQRLLLEYARLQLRIAISRMPAAEVDVTERYITRSRGYKRLRWFFLGLNVRRKELFRRQMRTEIEGVQQVLEQALANGEELSLADITITLRDETGTPMNPPTFGEIDESEEHDASPVTPNTEQ